MPRAVAHALDAVSGLATLQRLYDAQPARRADGFIEQAVAALDVTVAAHGDLDRVPGTGGVLIVANHPCGALDGLALAALVRRVRADVKLLGNQVLCRIPELQPHVVPVDAFTPGTAHNAAGVRAAVEWLRAGHALVVFPAGEVSHVLSAGGVAVDGAWREGAARMAARADVPVLPMFLDGQNSAWFLHAGRVSPWLRSGLLARELLRQRGRTVTVRVGRAVSQRRLQAIGDAAAQTSYLRIRSYGLGEHAPARGALRRHPVKPTRPQSVAPPVPPDVLAAEIAALPACTRLTSQGPWSVCYVTARQAPRVLQEIGRLRELTFRAAGEGTGRATDLDRFDWHYRHLFVWHQEAQQVVGAYRIAATDDVLARRGIGGFYTRTLFRYKAALLRELGPALELGRSFVREEYQRDYQPLLQLWRGIGAVVAAEPRYRMLFGPVSISAQYGATTRRLLAKCLLASRSSALRSHVAARRPLPDDASDGSEALVHSRVAANLHDVDALVRDLESDQRGLPVLLRHYLKLNAKLLGFSVDPAFGNVLDGLVVVDLLDVDRALLGRYLGKDAAATLVAAHRSETVTPHIEAGALGLA